MADFPALLPSPTVQSYQLSPAAQTIRTDMEVGAPRARRRTRARLDRLSVRWVLTDQEMLIFRAWADSDLYAASGAAWWWITLAMGDGGLRKREARFTGPWRAVPVSDGSVWEVTAEIEVRGGELTEDQARGAVLGFVRENVYPTLAIDFCGDLALDSRISFTRASTGTYIGGDGLVRTAAANAPRFQYDAATGQCLGLLIEEQRTNRIRQSERFDLSPWTVRGATLVSSTRTDPAGGNSAQEWTIGANATADLYQTVTGLSVSVAVQPSMWIWPVSTSGTLRLVNASDGTKGDWSINLSMLPAGKWTRITVFHQAVTVNNAFVTTGAGASGIQLYASPSVTVRLWGAQLEVGPGPTSYIPTTTSTVTRSADVATITGTNFSSWYSAGSEATWFAEWMGGLDITQGGYGRALGHGTGASTLISRTQGNNGKTVSSWDNTTPVDLAIDVYPNLVMVKSALAVTQTTRTLSARGLIASGSHNGIFMLMNDLRLGANGNGNNYLNGTIRKLVYWPARLSNQTLIDLTSA
jgi:hypothetical protein